MNSDFAKKYGVHNAFLCPFKDSDISWRVGSTNKKKCADGKATKGIPLAYIDARDVMKRLDDVVGMANWMDDYKEVKGRIICTLSIKTSDGWVSKCDGAGDTETEGEKGGISDAFKRAAVKYGIGRYLYSMPNVWVELDDWGKPKQLPKIPDNLTQAFFIQMMQKKEG